MRKCTVSLWLYEALEWTNEVKREAEQTMERKRTDEIENENEDLGLRAFRVATTICHHFARIGVYAHFNLLYLHLFQQRNKIKYSQCYNCIVFFTWVFSSFSLPALYRPLSLSSCGSSAGILMRFCDWCDWNGIYRPWVCVSVWLKRARNFRNVNFIGWLCCY